MPNMRITNDREYEEYYTKSGRFKTTHEKPCSSETLVSHMFEGA